VTAPWAAGAWAWPVGRSFEQVVDFSWESDIPLVENDPGHLDSVGFEGFDGLFADLATRGGVAADQDAVAGVLSEDDLDRASRARAGKS